MSSRHLLTGILIIGVLTSSIVLAQQLNARERARQPYAEGLAHMRAEAFDAAARAFRAAVSIDPEFEMAHYMLGRVHLVQKQYVSAVYALEKSRDLHIAEASRAFQNKQEGQRLRRERLVEMDRLISDLRQVVPQTFRIVEQIRQLRERKRQLENWDRADDLTPGKLVPAFVSLSLGSAYFRSGKLAEAERAYLATIAADPKTGEAHNNLAVVYFETGRYTEAERAVRAAEKAGVRVHPDLKADIAANR